VAVIDTAEETVEDVRAALVQEGLLRDENSDPPSRAFYVSDVPAQFRVVGERFLGEAIESLVWIDQNDLPWYERFGKEPDHLDRAD